MRRSVGRLYRSLKRRIGRLKTGAALSTGVASGGGQHVGTVSLRSESQEWSASFVPAVAKVGIELHLKKALPDRALIITVDHLDGVPVERQSVGSAWHYSRHTGGQFANVPPSDGRKVIEMPELELPHRAISLKISVLSWGPNKQSPQDIVGSVRFKGDIDEPGRIGFRRVITEGTRTDA